MTVLLAVAGGSLGLMMKLPAGALLGSMVAVAIVNILGINLEMPQSFNTLAQMIIGSFLGLMVTQEVISGLKSYLLSSIMVVVLLAVFGALTGFIVSKITGIDLYTSIFGSVPGGMQEMVVLSEAYDVNHPAVVVIQAVRRVMIVIIYPLLVHLISKITSTVIQIVGK